MSQQATSSRNLFHPLPFPPFDITQHTCQDLSIALAITISVLTFSVKDVKNRVLMI